MAQPKVYTASEVQQQTKTITNKRIKDLTGEVSGRLTVLSFAGQHPKSGASRWFCECVCGNITMVLSAHIKNGRTKSCGCLTREKAAKNSRTHGMARSPEYRAWDAMKRRCGNPSTKGYESYGARGISVCERWKSSFENFYKDLGPRPPGGYSLERIDNNKGYQPDNCCWADSKTQGNNRRTNIRIEFRGRCQTAIQWSRETGIKAETIVARFRRGWCINCVMKSEMGISCSHKKKSSEMNLGNAKREIRRLRSVVASQSAQIETLKARFATCNKTVN